MKRLDLCPRVSPLRGGLHSFTRCGRVVIVAIARGGRWVDETELGPSDDFAEAAHELAASLAWHERPARYLRLEQ